MLESSMYKEISIYQTRSVDRKHEDEIRIKKKIEVCLKNVPKGLKVL